MESGEQQKVSARKEWTGRKGGKREKKKV